MTSGSWFSFDSLIVFVSLDYFTRDLTDECVFIKIKNLTFGNKITYKIITS